MAATTTRAELRLRAARKIGDALEVVTTAAGNGGGTTFVDTTNLIHPDDALIGAQAVYASSGADLGAIRYVSDNVQSTGTVTVSVAFSAQVASGKVLHLFNLRDAGATVAQWNGWVDEAIDAVRDSHVTEVVSVTVPFDRDEPVIDLDDNTLTNNDAIVFWGVYGVDWQDSRDIWHELRGKRNLRVDRPGRTIELVNRARSLAAGRQIRVRGYQQVSLPTTDASTVAVDPEYVATFAAARALFSIEGQLGPDGQKALAKAQVWMDMAERRKQATRTQVLPGTVRL